MTPFLKEVAQKLYQEFGRQISQVYVVLPSRRAALYFKQYLTQVVSETIIAPEILSMDDFIRKLSQVQVVDRVTLLFELYRSYREFDKDPEHNLEKFAPLGTAILKDFGMIEKNLNEKETHKLFEHLEEVKALERWGEELGKPIEERNSKSLNEYFAFWANLKNTYWHFRSKLLERNQAYGGLSYRILFNNIEQIVQEREIKHISFVGFNQLTKVEEDMIDKLMKLEVGSAYWDLDNYYLENERHEAGDYMRKYLRRWLEKPLNFQGNSILTEPKEIHLIHANTQVSQGKLAGNLLKERIENFMQDGSLPKVLDKLNHTAILLPDESLLPTLLYSLPTFPNADFQIADHLNLTMGVALYKTPLFDLIDSVFMLQKNIQAQKNQEEVKIYYRDLQRILNHPFIQFDENLKVKNQEILKKIREKNLVYISLEKLVEWSDEHPLFSNLFSSWNDDMFEAIQYFLRLTEQLAQIFQAKAERLENEMLLQFYTVLRNLEEVFTKQGEALQIKTFRQFLYEIIKGQSIPFTGEPISPFQVMGMLESRGLDFENVIILSCNEGLLPQGKVLDSIIPFDLRLQFGLPTHKENDASFAYTFYRLFHRAKSLTLVYTDGSGGVGGGEKSRFITQIEEEMADLPHIQIKKLQLTLPLPHQHKIQDAIQKDEAVVQKIKAVLAKGISPSAINNYIKSPINFFYQSILKLRDVKNIEENIDHRTFGTMVHDTLDFMFKERIGSEIQSDDLQYFLDRPAALNDLMEEVIRKNLGGIVMERGKNYLLRQVAEKLINDFLKLQKENATPYFLVDQENFLGQTVQVNLPNGERIPFRVAGLADRIDVVGRNIRIVDYKTGSFVPKNLKATQIEQLLLDHEKEKIVQLLIYKYFLVKGLMNNEIQNLPPNFDLSQYQIQSGFYFFRQLKKDFIEYKLEDEPTDLHDFCYYVENFLSTFVRDVLDTEKDFREEASDFGIEVDI